MANLTKSQIDAIIDSTDEDESPATALADALDKAGAWDWTDDSDHDPSDRLAVIESTGAYWLVYRGSEGDEATRYATRDEADAEFDRKRSM
jgi:hypothetical protein